MSSVRGANELTSYPVLGVVSEAFPQRDRVRAVRNLWRFSAAAGALVVCFALVLTLNWVGARLAIQAVRSWVQA